ncbi:MAG: signal peptidase II [Candidatus Nanoarchaeia archaeon]
MKQITSPKTLFSKHTLQVLIAICIGIILLCVDQITKYLAKTNAWNTTGHIVDATLVYNKGSLWGLFASTQANTIFIILSFFILGIILWLGIQQQEPIKKIFLTILSAGIIGNLIDRISTGAVIDWINFHFWPVFNIADACIVISAIFIGYFFIKEEIKEYKKKK